MGPLGWQETVFIFLIALLIFGPKKLPELGKTIGKAMTEFRRASSELKATFDREMNSLERESQELKDVTSQYSSDPYSYESSSSYDYYGSNGSSSESSSATESTTVSASATEGADSTAVPAPEGAIASGSLAAEAPGDFGGPSTTTIAESKGETPAAETETVKS